jgi:ADP-ribose pyrophosphatase
VKYKILTEKTVYQGYIEVKQAQIAHETFGGDMIQVERLNVDRGDSVGVLVYETDTDCFLFTRQFRYPATGHQRDWLTEIAAGKIEAQDTAEESAKREVLEELGYEVNDLTFVCEAYATPGASSERYFLYYAEVTSNDKVANGGGILSETEDVEIVKVPAADIKSFLKNALIEANSVLTVQWWLLR